MQLLDEILSAQYRRPSGILGIWVSRQMTRYRYEIINRQALKPS
jgi:hypothetical protein